MSTGNPLPDSCEQALAQWDADLFLTSVMMGEIGPGYEQMIQIMAMECVRYLLSYNVEDIDQLTEQMQTVCRQTAEEHNWQPTQVQAVLAMNLASMTKRHGWSGAVMLAPPQRRIMIKKSFP